jgi:hypothetical protein
MSRRTRRRIRRRLVPLGLALALIAVAVPFAGSATAKGPVFLNPCTPIARNVPPPPDQPRVGCDPGAARTQSVGDAGGTDAGLVAGGAALLALTLVAGVFVAMRPRRTPPPRTATQH